MTEWGSTRSDQDRQKLRNLLVEGAESPPAVMADAAYFETLRAGVNRQSKGWRRRPVAIPTTDQTGTKRR